ncbi:MAG: DUF2334 domain-containing protein [Myxococcales bacterium]|nr:DUF2334 domain-containing protein [Myxococcales bacterium]
MKAKRVSLLFPILLGILAFSATSRAATVIYYDRQTNGMGVTLANMIYNLAGHFDTDLTERDVAGYQAGDLSAFDRAIYLGTVYRPLPPAFLAAVAQGERPVFWIGGSIDQLTDLPGVADQLGFRYRDYTLGAGFDRIRYKDRWLIRRQLFDFYQLEFTDDAEVYAVVADDGVPPATYPYFLRGANVWYWADIPFFSQLADDRYFVFADALHEFFGPGVPVRRTALLRLEDLAPGATHCDELYSLIESLAAEGIPFAFDLTPFFVDPIGVLYPPGTVKRFPDDPELVDLVNAMLKNGGTMVMHGVTHQHDNGVSLNDWEFVQGAGNEPLPGDSAAWARGRVESGLAEFAAQGWRPLIWETPHYGASHGDYRVFAEYFAWDFEQPLIFPLSVDAPASFGVAYSPPSQVFPYVSPVGSNGMGFIPENLGYINPAVPGQRPADLLERARRLTIVRDATACFYAHNGLVNPDDVWEVIDGLREQGYEFVSIAELIGDDDDDDNNDNDNDDNDNNDNDNDDNDDVSPTPAPGDDDDDGGGSGGCF